MSLRDRGKNDWLKTHKTVIGILRAYILVGCLCLIWSFIAATQWARGEAKNDSSIKVTGPDSKHPYYLHDRGAATNVMSICAGEAPNGLDLSMIGRTNTDLKDGVSCVHGDFDGNGCQDLVLNGPKGALVLFFEHGQIVRSQKLATFVIVFGVKHHLRKFYPKYKSVPGLIKPSEGDMGFVYFFDKKSGLFEKVTYVFPPGFD